MLWTRWLVLLLCWGASGGEQQAEERDGTQGEVRSDSRRQRSPPPVEPLDFGFVPPAVYDTHAYYEPGTIGILFHVVHAFLYVVQPNSFPTGETLMTSDPPNLVISYRFFQLAYYVYYTHFSMLPIILLKYIINNKCSGNKTNCSKQDI